ncbi:hypothetical protein HDF16_006195 [Granulicella aggregans]|uniref:Uncharacterized protein n=1 Tax=Granulicella aggregans TaxID=474949 RepID=A0A7W8E7I9_9BACT|nr:hypothetical protein [Granulicella aggregans]MBB5061459.1 hypothetical protein [Granulicella aggregans]
MGFAHDLKKDIEAAKKVRLPWWAILAWAAVCLPVVSLLNHVSRLELALPILGSLAIFLFPLGLKWDLKRRIWFWVTVLGLIILHVPLILFVPWTAKWVSPIVTGGIASADLCLLLGILSAIGRLFDPPRRKTRSSIG